MAVVERVSRRAASIVATVFMLTLAALPARAADEPWVLDSSTADRAKDLLPDAVMKRVRAGEYRFKVVPADPARFRENYSKAFWDASAANAGKYDLDPKTCGLRD